MQQQQWFSQPITGKDSLNYLLQTDKCSGIFIKVITFDCKKKAGDYVWQMDPVWLVMKGPTLVSTKLSFATFQGARRSFLGIFGVQVCSLPPCGVAESLPGYHGSLGNSSYLLVPETSCSSLNPYSFWQHTPCCSLDILTSCLPRCPLQWFKDSPPP